MLRNGGGGGPFFWIKCYEGVRCNVISVMREWVGVQFPEIKRYVTLVWPLKPGFFQLKTCATFYLPAHKHVYTNTY